MVYNIILYILIQGSNMLNTDKKKSNIRLLIILFCVFAITFGIMSYDKYINKNNGVIASNSVFDFKNTSPDDKKIIYLNGTWEFFYNSLLFDDNTKNTAVQTQISVPSSWYDIKKGPENIYKPGGFASYRCTLKNINAKNPVVIYIPNIAASYKIYLNEKLITTSGSFSKNPKELSSTTEYNAELITFDKDKTYTLTIEIISENFSGLYMSPILANASYNKTYNGAMITIRFAVAGILFFMGILFIFMQQIWKIKQFSIWLPILSFILFIRLLIANEGYMYTQFLFGFVSYEKLTAYIFALTYAAKLAALMYLRDSQKLSVPDNTLVMFSAFVLAIIIFSRFFPKLIYSSYSFAILQLSTFVIDIYTLEKLCQKIIKKQPYSITYTIIYTVISLGIIVDAFYSYGLIHFKISSFLSICLFIFILGISYVYAGDTARYYKDALEKSKLQTELATAKQDIMLTQIQPHFLYNALNTIKSLIKRNPKSAEKAVVDFSLYLRGNMDSLSEKTPIDILKEIEHIKHYTSIEELRFSDKLTVIYDIKSVSFLVPTLSVQPLVENAVKHGITKKVDGGTVKISTYEDKSNYYVKVEDNGVGFDPYISKDNEKKHYGIEITKQRLSQMINAKLTIKSEIGKGTTAVISLPKANNKITENI